MKNHITKTFLVMTILITNPLDIQALEKNKPRTKDINHSQIELQQELSKRLSIVLENKGIEKKSSKTIVNQFLKNNNLSIKQINKLSSLDFVSKEKIIENLSMKALHKKKIELDNYSDVVGMITKILNKPLNQAQLKKIGILI